MLAKLIRFFSRPPLDGPKATLLLRLMVGSVFFWEGLLKFVYVNQGVGRFTKLGMPIPEMLAPAIAYLEIGGGLLLIFGLATRWIALPFIIEMVVAMLSTKVSLYFGTSPLALPPAPPKVGAWAVLHEIRSDWAQIMTSAYLLWAGPGPWSLDAIIRRKANRTATDQPAATAATAAPSDVALARSREAPSNRMGG
ncbi:MAG TPA: DoxX family protein [Polyangia bacterium]